MKNIIKLFIVIFYVNCVRTVTQKPKATSNAKSQKQKMTLQEAIHLPDFLEVTKHKNISILCPSKGIKKELLDIIKDSKLNFHIEEDMILPKDKKTKFRYLDLSNTAEYRAKSFIDAINNPNIDVIICGKGGYGSSDIIPYLENIPIPMREKTLIGYSDITILHLFLEKRWDWHPIHGSMLFEVTNKEKHKNNFSQLAELILREKRPIIKDLHPLNSLAEKSDNISAKITGGNMTILQTSLGYPKKLLDTKNKILIIEDVYEFTYSIRRTLTQFNQAGVFSDVKAIVFGKFIPHKSDPNIHALLKELSETLLKNIPVYKTDSIGHGKKNIPWQYNTKYEIKEIKKGDFILNPT